MVEANAKVAQSLFKTATQGDSVAAAIFWMKARAGWREKSSVGHSVGPAPLAVSSRVPRADDLLDAEVAGRAQDDETDAPGGPTSRRSYVIGGIEAELTPEQRIARYGRGE